MRDVLKIRACLLMFSVAVNTGTAGSPLFENAEPITMTIVAPMRELIRKRQGKPGYEALLQFEDAAGNRREMAIGLAPRGNSRLEVCDYPPLRITIDPQQAVGTVFEHQRRLKMVTKCRRNRPAADWLLLEYGIYLAYNVITDFSYRARRLEVTFRDTTSDRWERVQTAFLIEPTGEAAERLQRQVIRPPNVSANQFNRVEMAHNALFQYLIANTDFAVKRGPVSEGCCHNGRLLAPAGVRKDWIVLPYDFDQAGVINTEYALPDSRFRIRGVSTRLYRGFCWHNDELPESIALFNERRDEIVAALLTDGLSNSKARRVLKYIDRFYNTVNDPQELQKQLIDKCRGPGSLPVRKTTVSQAN